MPFGSIDFIDRGRLLIRAVAILSLVILSSLIFQKQNTNSLRVVSTLLHSFQFKQSNAGISQSASSVISEKISNSFDASTISQITTSLKEKEYDPSLSGENNWVLINRKQNFNSTISSNNWNISPLNIREGSSPQWHWNYSFLGLSPNTSKVANPGKNISEVAQRVKVEHDSNVTEWFTNSKDGIEQGFTVNSRPSNMEQGRLVLYGEVSTDLSAGSISNQEIIFSSDGTEVLKYSKLVAFDRTGKSLPSSFEFLKGNDGKYNLNIIVNDAGAEYPLTIDPLADSPAWSDESIYDTDNYGESVSTAGDVNGDGYSDIIVSLPNFASGGGNNGKVFAYYGSATGPSLVANWEYGFPTPLANFGSSIATAGDVNGDGYSDIIIGANGYSNGQSAEGAAFVFMGSPAGLANNFAWSAESNKASAVFGNSVASAGDVNGDGYSDVIVGARFYSNTGTSEGRAYIYHGSATGLSTTPATILEKNVALAAFGWSVSSAGDVNGDGYADVIVGSPRFQATNNNEGAAYIFLGSASGVSTTESWLTRSANSEIFYGTSVSTAGDLNGDGYADVIVGAPEYTNGQLYEGRAYMFLGGGSGPSTIPTWTKESDLADARFGNSVSSAGDVNGDGYGDIIIGAYTYSNGESREGAAYIFEGSSTGLSANPSWQSEPNLANTSFATSVSLAGDVNGDGFSDVIIGSPNYDAALPNVGRAQVFYGKSSTVQVSNQWGYNPSATFSELGTGTSGIGDVNGDGYEDLVTGLPGNGEIRVFLGSANGPSEPANRQYFAGAGTEFGYRQTGAGDVNGDGYDDLIVGLRNFNATQGKISVYYGSASGLSMTPSWTITGPVGQTAGFGSSVAGAGDVNCDGYADIIYGASGYTNGQSGEGAVFVHYGSPTGPSVSPNWTYESNLASANLGTAVASAGDVNRDGCSDIIIGHPTYSNGQANEGRYMVFHGSRTGLSSSPDRAVELNVAGGRLGTAVSSAGDVNGDGYSDVVVGAPNLSIPEANEGFIFLFLGSASGVSATASFSIASDNANALLGSSLANGDINGDGYSDLILGAPGYANKGRIYIFHGGSSGPLSSPTRILENNVAASKYGAAVSVADVNGDGVSDVLTGSPESNLGGAFGGTTYAYFGNNGGGLSTIPQQLKSNGSLMASHSSAGGTSFGIRLLARTPSGRTRSRLVWEVKPFGTNFNGGGLGFGNWSLLNLTGSTLSTTINDIFSSTPYHWRARIQYFPSMNYSMWYSVGNNGSNEQGFRSSGFDNIGPSVVISSSSSNPTATSPIPFTATFSEPVTGFDVSDIVATNGTKSNFTSVSSKVYTFQITPSANGNVAIDIPTNVALDGGGDGNLAATSFTVTYNTLDTDNDGTIDIDDTDDDNDGTTDNQEATDGTNPLDSGSTTTRLPVSWCSEWNGFLGLFNINEYVNLSNENRSIEATIFSIEGAAQSTNGVSVLGGAQTDFLVHGMLGWRADSYGKICSQQIDGSAGDIDGRMVYYKPNEAGYDFAFAMPFQAGIKGSQFITFNTYQPSLSFADSGNLVTNWIQITNLSNSAETGTLIYYGQDGVILAVDNISLDAGARRDFAGHQFGSNLVGIIEWRPANINAEFLVRNTRYYYNNNGAVNSFDSAMQLEAVRGNGELMSVPLDTNGKTAVLEVANVTSSETLIDVKFYHENGTEMGAQTLLLPPYGSTHLIADSILNGSLGMATVKGTTPSSVLAVGMHYGRTPFLGIQYVYGIIAKQSIGTTLKGSYNTFLSQGCDILLVNSSNSPVNSTVSMRRFDGTSVLDGQALTTPAKGVSSYNVCVNELPNNYGVVTLSTASPNALYPTIVRVGRENMYRFPTTVK